MLTPVLTSVPWDGESILPLAGGALVSDKASLSAFAEVTLFGKQECESLKGSIFIVWGMVPKHLSNREAVSIFFLGGLYNLEMNESIS